MTKCPKCGGTIGGPRYESNVVSEWLRYMCIKCGYSTTAPTDDARRAPELLAALKGK